jgi:hypothetical protein
VEGSVLGLILMYYLDICLEALRKVKKNLSSDSQCPGQDSNSEPPEYKSEALCLEAATRWTIIELQ